MGSEPPCPESERLAAIVDAVAAALDCSRDEAIARLEAFAMRGAPEPTAFPKAIRTLQRSRMRRNELLGVDLFRDPAWDMLLELVLAHREGKSISVSALCAASGVPQTTALRHIDRMADAGIVTRTGDFADQRRVLVAPAPMVIPRLEGMFRDIETVFGVAAMSSGAATPNG